jgi:tellurite methyltransferase
MDYTGDWHRLYREHGRVFGEEPKPLVQQALELWAPPSDSPSAFDIGSYTGRNALFFARHGFRVWALDPSGPALEDLKAQADGEGLMCDIDEGFIETYAWRDSYDAIVFCGVSHSLSLEDAQRTLDNMKKYTRPGGINIISAFSELAKSHQKSFFTAEQLRAAYAGWEFLAFVEQDTSLKLPTPDRDRVTVIEAIIRKTP